MIYYKRQAGQEMIALVDHYEELIDAMEDAGRSFGEAYITADMVRTYQSRLSTSGFSAERLHLAQELEISSGELESIKQTLLAFDPDEVEDYYMDVLDESLDALTQLGTQWTRLPEVDPYWLKN